MAGQYSTSVPFISSPPSWVSLEDRDREMSYALYEDMYDNNPETFKLSMRGTNDDPIYIPSAKIIIEATNRFLAKDFRFAVDPKEGEPAARDAVSTALDNLFVRENFYAKFATQKRYGLIRGDAVWHITADPSKPAGSRISIYDIDPGSYFPIHDDDDEDKIVGCHLVDVILEDDGTERIKRQTYRKTDEGIVSECAIFENTKWDDRVKNPGLKRIRTILPPTLLPSYIKAIPVYHIKNNRMPGATFGTSEIKGLERLFMAVNQAISDEELALALDGIGLYFTTSGPPTDDRGNEIDWILGPGRVVEGDTESDFKRVSGVSNVQPVLDHVKFIMGTAMQAAGVPDIAAGNVDVSIAESGIALAMQLSPLLAKNAEKEVEMLGVYSHMVYDIVNMWFPAYEQLQFPGVVVHPVVDDPMPVNKTQELTNILTMYAAGVVSLETVHARLSALGFDLSPDEIKLVREEQKLRSELQYGAYSSRVRTETSTL